MDLFNAKKKKKILVAAHRGVSGGNIIQNTIPSYETALKMGADIIEVDVMKTADGKLICFHTGQEKGLFQTEKDIRTMSLEEINEMSFFNSMQERISQKPNSIDEVLEHFKNKCFINIDRSWWHFKEIIECINKHNMFDQVILKSPSEEKLLSILEENGKDIMYMPIVREREAYLLAKKYKINLVAVEINFTDEQQFVASDEFADMAHKDGCLIWTNALTLNDRTKLSAGHDDNLSILSNEGEGWGWHIRKGYDIVQTDWPMLVNKYIKG